MDIYMVSSVLFRLSRRRYQVRDIKLDMTPNMEQIVRSCFPTAKRVIDRFHKKLAYEAVLETLVAQKRTRQMPHPKCFHNGIILIVICFQIYVDKYIYNFLILLYFSINFFMFTY